MGDATKVDMGVCNVTFDGNDLGFTKGYVKASYTAETVEKTVDQVDTPIDEFITKQTFEVTVPMAETDLERLSTLLPGTTLSTGIDEDDGNFSLYLSGAAGGSLSALGKKLVLQPVGGDANDYVTLFNAVPIPTMEFSYDKENVRIYEVKFKAIPDEYNNWVLFGNESLVVLTF
jgi:hypothetical protein